MEAKVQLKDGKVKWEEFKMSLSYQELLGIEREAIEFEWSILPGFSTLQTPDHLHVNVQRHRLDKERK